jgi:hypothetical protein
VRRFVGLLLLLPVVCFARNLKVVPTTTLTAQTSNNTSAANSFATQSNGNLGAGNVSKVNTRWLLYPGSSARIYAHLMLWFGQNNHMNVGYSSADPLQVKRQIDDMISRGIHGVILDWYGPNNFVDQAAQAVMHEAEAHPGFTFAIMVDQGAIKWNPCPGCSPQETLVADLQYVEQTYFPSRAYMTVNGQPMVTNFDIDRNYSVDWNAAKAAMSTDAYFLFQNKDGFNHDISNGSYSWVMPQTQDYGMSYLSDFYATGMGFPSQLTTGASYKGFNDSLAGWGSGRVMSQQCGQTWLDTFSKINTLYNPGNPLGSLQLVTWNDYEEGTEIESGIDNCVQVSANMSGQSLLWNLSGDESGVARYKVFISKDGEHLMPLIQMMPGTRSVNMCSFSLPPNGYTLYVKAIGQPSFSNHMSGPVTYNAQCN